MYQQLYNPLGNAFLSTLAAAVPIATLLTFIARHRHRDTQGNAHLGISFALGSIFRTVSWHSLAGAPAIGIIAMLQAYLFTGAVADSAGREVTGDAAEARHGTLPSRMQLVERR